MVLSADLSFVQRRVKKKTGVDEPHCSRNTPNAARVSEGRKLVLLVN